MHQSEPAIAKRAVQKQQLPGAGPTHPPQGDTDGDHCEEGAEEHCLTPIQVQPGQQVLQPSSRQHRPQLRYCCCCCGGAVRVEPGQQTAQHCSCQHRLQVRRRCCCCGGGCDGSAVRERGRPARSSAAAALPARRRACPAGSPKLCSLKAGSHFSRKGLPEPEHASRQTAGPPCCCAWGCPPPTRQRAAGRLQC